LGEGHSVVDSGGSISGARQQGRLLPATGMVPAGLNLVSVTGGCIPTDALESSCAAQSLRRLRRFFIAGLV